MGEADQLVFAAAVGTPLDDHNVRRPFQVIAEAAGLMRLAGAVGYGQEGGGR
jgi:hypothetical protein